MTLQLLASSYAGFATLALAMSRYRKQVWPRVPADRLLRALRALGALGLAVSLWVAVRAHDWALGLVSWVAVLTVASLALTLALTYLPRHVARSAVLAWLLTAVAVAATASGTS